MIVTQVEGGLLASSPSLARPLSLRLISKAQDWSGLANPRPNRLGRADFWRGLNIEWVWPRLQVLTPQKLSCGLTRGRVELTVQNSCRLMHHDVVE